MLARQASLEEARQQPRRRARSAIARASRRSPTCSQAQTVGLAGRARPAGRAGPGPDHPRARSRRRSACSANVPVDVGELPEELPLDAVQKSVDELIAAATAERPDLAAERFRRWRRRATSSRCGPKGLPKLPRTRQRAIAPSTTRRAPPTRSRPTTRARCSLRIPVFTGFDIDYRTQKAREEAEAARRHRRADRGPRDPRRLVELLRRADRHAAGPDDARPAREREPVGRGRRTGATRPASARSSTS